MGWWWHFLRPFLPLGHPMMKISFPPLCRGRQTHHKQDRCLLPKPDSPSPPAWLCPRASGPGRPQNSHLLVPLGMLYRLLCVWEEQPFARYNSQRISECSPQPHMALPRAPCRHPAVPWPRAGTSTSPESLCLITTILVETTSSVGVNSQDLGNARQNQKEKQNFNV